MTSRHRGIPEPRRDRSPSARLAALEQRLTATEHRQRRLRNTVGALASEVGCSLGCPCTRCDESYTLVRDGGINCPRCGYRESL